MIWIFHNDYWMIAENDIRVYRCTQVSAQLNPQTFGQ